MTTPDTMIELVADLDATARYINDQVTDRSDSMDFDELVAAIDATEQVMKACRAALSMIRTEMVRQLEGAGSRQVGTKTYVRVPDTKQRFDHNAISRAIRERAINGSLDRDTGEIDYRQAVAQVAADLLAVYVAPATTAKTTVLKSLDVNVKSVSTREVTGYKIEVIDSGFGDEDDD